jgi:membrane protease YdiL (CAAX protease family)
MGSEIGVRDRSRPHSLLAGLFVVTAAVVFALSSAPANLRQQTIAAVVLAVVTSIAFALKVSAAIRALVYLDAAFAVFSVGVLASWPAAVTTVVACLAPLAALSGCGRFARLRPATPWLRPGRLTRDVVALGITAILVAALAITVWSLAVHPDASAYLHGLRDYPLWLGIVGIGGFALVNPIWEETLFRGVVLTELARTWGVRAAVIVQAVVFGMAHWAGIPSGWLGMVMAGCWGLVLGIIRVRSRGILIPYVVHVCVDAVIAALAFTWQ